MTDASALGKRSRRKGKEGERQVRDLLRAWGVSCEKTGEFKGDVILHPPPSLPYATDIPILLEVKYRETITPALIRDALVLKEFVMWRQNRRPWSISTTLRILLWLWTRQIEHLSNLDIRLDSIITLSAEDWVKLWLAR